MFAEKIERRCLRRRFSVDVYGEVSRDVYGDDYEDDIELSCELEGERLCCDRIYAVRDTVFHGLGRPPAKPAGGCR